MHTESCTSAYYLARGSGISVVEGRFWSVGLVQGFLFELSRCKFSGRLKRSQWTVLKPTEVLTLPSSPGLLPGCEGLTGFGAIFVSECGQEMVEWRGLVMTAVYALVTDLLASK